MSFEKVLTTTRGDFGVWVTFGVTACRRGYLRTFMTLSSGVVTYLGLDSKSKVELYLGKNEDEGWLALRKADDNAVDAVKVGMRSSGAARLQFSGLGYPRHKASKITPDGLSLILEHREGCRWCYFELPGWAQKTKLREAV